MAIDTRMTVRLDPTTRRKVERLAAMENISMNEALNRLLREAPEDGAQPKRPRRYKLKPRTEGFGFDHAKARDLANELSDLSTLKKLQDEP